jgi:dolichyl-diphosphooligosaccharide--protein glycosyltransferase
MEKPLPMRSASRAFAQAACLFAAFAACVGLRLLEAPRWFAPELLLDGQPLMSTHDAYAWLAGAMGVNLRGHEPLAVIVELVNGLTGLSPEAIGFWLPPLLAALAGLPFVHLAHRLGILAFGFPAAVVAGCSLGYVVRTRVGSLDTDPFALFFPLFLAVELFITLSPLLREVWRGPAEKPDVRGAPDRVSVGACFGSFGLGLWCMAGVWLYAGMRPVITILLCFAALLGAALGRPQVRPWSVVLPLLPLAMLALGGGAGVVVGLGFALAVWRRPELGFSRRAGWTIAAALALMVVVFGFEIVRDIVVRLDYWLFPAADVVVSATNGPNLPSVLQSIREAQSMPLVDVARYLSVHPVLTIALVLGYAWLAFRRPAALVFVPLLALGLCASILGARFVMFGAAAMGAGVLGLGLLARRFVPRAWGRFPLAVALAGAILVPATLFMDRLRPDPVLSPRHAAALAEISSVTPSSSWLWLWWDYGYAAEFYAERFPIANGARHDAKWLYPLAAVHAGKPFEAANLMRFFAFSMQAQERALSERPEISGNPSFIHERTPPMTALAGLDGLSAQAEAQAVADGRRKPEGGYPDQYFVVSWDTLRLAGWIIRFGTRNLADGTFATGDVSRIEGDMRVDTEQGLLHSPLAGTLPLASLDVLDEAGNSGFSWQRGSGMHVVMNRQTREAFMMDATAYGSAMVQLLVGEPSRFARDFELVIDAAPWARVYRLLP